MHILPALGGKRASEITRQDVSRLHGAIAAGKGKGPKRPNSKRTAPEKVRGGRVIANRVLSTLAATYAWALDPGLLPPGNLNPAKGIEPFHEEGPERYLTPKEMARLGVASRTVVWLSLEKFRFQFVPVLHRLQGRLAAQS